MAEKKKKKESKPKKQTTKKRPVKKKKVSIDQELSEKELIVVLAYIKNRTWSKARCYRLGFPDCDKMSAYPLATHLFRRPHVKKYIDNFRKKMIREVELDVQFVLKNLMKICEFSPQCLLNNDGTPKPVNEIHPDDAKVIQSIKFDYIENGRGKDKKLIPIIDKYKIPNQTQALDLLGKYLKLWSDKSDLSIKVSDRKFEIEFFDHSRNDDGKS